MHRRIYQCVVHRVPQGTLLSQEIPLTSTKSSNTRPCAVADDDAFRGPDCLPPLVGAR